jgi:GTP-binding protein HflX
MSRRTTDGGGRRDADTTPAFSLDRSEYAKRLAETGEGGRTRAAVLHPDLPPVGGRKGSGADSAAETLSAHSGGFAKRSAEARLEEAVGLARAIDLDVVHAAVVAVNRIRPATLLGLGAVEDLRADFDARFGHGAVEVVVVDGALTPVQQRNLEKAFDCKVIDRTGLILEIFGARARTKEGRLQVELAALSYQRSRLVRSWTHLERQRGGHGFMGGPGETQIETDRRLIDERIVRLKKDLALVRKTRGLHRAARKRVPYPIVALVGYTNAGKSTLFNALTAAQVMAQDQVFATLDPTMRALALPSGRSAILSDTVGFVSDLPHELVEAFRATLEEVEEADVIIHVRDVAHPDTDAQCADVLSVLGGLGVLGDADDDRVPETPPTPTIEALNKIDALSPEERIQVADVAARRNTPAVPVSALRGEGLDDLLQVIETQLDAQAETVDIRLPFADGETLAWVYRNATVLDRSDADDGVHVRARLSAPDRARLERRIADADAAGTEAGAGVSVSAAPGG